MRNLEQLKEASKVYEHSEYSKPDVRIRNSRVATVRQADPGNNDAKMKLAEIYEILGETRRALDLVYEGMC